MSERDRPVAAADISGDLVSEISRMVSDWEDSDELATPFAVRVVSRIRQYDRKNPPSS